MISASGLARLDAHDIPAVVHAREDERPRARFAPQPATGFRHKCRPACASGRRSSTRGKLHTARTVIESQCLQLIERPGESRRVGVWPEILDAGRAQGPERRSIALEDVLY